MLTHETQIRVRYGETDQMGYLYYGNYAQYYEVARVEMIRSLGMTYKQMEEKGVMMPVSSMQIKYLRPAKYDDLITIKTSVPELPSKRIRFTFELYNGNKKLLNTAEVQLAFVDMKTGRSCFVPEYLLEKVKPFFEV